MTLRVRSFHYANAQCYQESDRETLESLIAHYMKDLNLDEVPPDCADVTALEAFNDLVRKEVPKAITNNFRPLGVPFWFALVVAMPAIGSSMDTLAATLFVSSDLRQVGVLMLNHVMLALMWLLNFAVMCWLTKTAIDVVGWREWLLLLCWTAVEGFGGLLFFSAKDSLYTQAVEGSDMAVVGLCAVTLLSGILCGLGFMYKSRRKVQGQDESSMYESQGSSMSEVVGAPSDGGSSSTYGPSPSIPREPEPIVKEISRCSVISSEACMAAARTNGNDISQANEEEESNRCQEKVGDVSMDDQICASDENGVALYTAQVEKLQEVVRQTSPYSNVSVHEEDIYTVQVECIHRIESL